MIPFGFSRGAILVIGLAAGLSSIPDIDLKLGINHRGVTHNIFTALLVGIAFGFLFLYSTSDILKGVIGFVGGFGGIVCHLIGDAFTPMKFKPLRPFSNRESGRGWFKSDNKLANDGFMILGLLAFVLYFFMTTGALAKILESISLVVGFGG